ncbi:MAG: isocitrate/isopropylmalate dehydrogenase family protein [Candidatus Bathyarchaeota archaeon]|uniref:isocitrate/isopropylmalate dehydrogenase family protein n=1 Tax=Candidatus Bathycorpusculum sp. TaxID=2994959 RepID=UPI002825BD38|nr:isocitrate/isopropylmalate dehydrogenase family protein [Candidatus Termiticorpusculum sp.]MCL2257500.1 isocitrate/isopropylmalate dehydrogenase family protein [Candidatus Termiticorpusculum sp.]MCL2292365.1 isocitrate/isopropylmalate dehydrogenase family protein [Candidatus Termiticorpusculum sp.]
MTAYKIALMPGDGIGPELTEAALKILDVVQENFNITLNMLPAEAGDAVYKRAGVALPEDSLRVIRESHACLKGPVGETAADVIVRLRLLFDLYANVRPIKAFPNVPVARSDIDMIFVRENTEDVYKGLEYSIGDDTAVCLRVITRKNCERIAKRAFETACLRSKKKKVTAIHKANVMRVTDGLFKRVCQETAKNYPDIIYNEMYVDAATMHLIRTPQDFDVLCTCNMFGDILSDEAAQLIGGLGMAPGANIGDNFALFEPIHGSAPDIAGKQIANPISMILSTKMMLDWLGERFNDSKCLNAAAAIERAVIQTLINGPTVPDLGGKASTLQMAQAIAVALKNSL